MTKSKICLSIALSLLLIVTILGYLVAVGSAELPKPTFADLPYISGGEERQQLDIYLPEGYEEGEKLPVLVWIHGGGWVAGSKKDVPWGFDRSFFYDGFAHVCINYRYATQVPFPAQVEDCKAAIRWIRANADKYRFDTTRIGVWGGSAGGHLVSMLGITANVKEFDVGENVDQSSAVHAVCDIFGPSDLTILEDSDFFQTLFGGKKAEKGDLVKKMSPLFYVTAETGKSIPCFLILQGSKDMLVPADQSIRLDKALKEVGVDSELVVVDGAGHDGKVVTNEKSREMLNQWVEKLRNK